MPLFPLGIVLLPGEVLPLHIFEPRYRELVARCLAGPEPFCIVHADDEGLREVGCLAVGLEVVERFDDGRLSIVVTGGEPLQIQRVDEEAHPYLAADGVTIEDDEELATDEAVEQALDAYRELVDVAEGGEGPPEPEAGPRLSYEIAGRIDFGPEVKQRLLEVRSEPRRLHEVVELVVRATRAVRTASAVSARARTNGRVSPPEEVDTGETPAVRRWVTRTALVTGSIYRSLQARARRGSRQPHPSSKAVRELDDRHRWSDRQHLDGRSAGAREPAILRDANPTVFIC